MRFLFRIGQRVAVDMGRGPERIATIRERSRLKTVGMFTLPDGGPFYTLDDGDIVRQAQCSLPEVLPIIFRAERSGAHKGEVTAVFPTLPFDVQGRQLTCYAHVGQHSGGSFGWYAQTRAATDEEAAPLLAELRRIYERAMCVGDDLFALRPMRRMTTQHRAELAA